LPEEADDLTSRYSGRRRSFEGLTCKSLGEQFTFQRADVGEQQRICCPAKLSGAIERIQWFTIVWISIEVGISLFTAIRARSIALAAFGADSAIELFAATIKK
jgi:hypothetical protein